MPEPALRTSPAERPTTRRRPALFRALGRQDPPSTITVDGETWTLAETLKHDSWAATAVYEHQGHRIVCKLNRRKSIFGFPMRWLGRTLARRERWFLTTLARLGHVPFPCDRVYVDGKPLWNAVARPFVPGHPLGADESVDDAFFPALQQRLREMHRHCIAYVDLHKRENVLVGTDGRPYLIDFQVCVHFPRWLLWCCPPLRLVLKALQRADLYHLQKHVTRIRPDQSHELVSGMEHQRPLWIKAHRLFAAPLRQLRRALLTRLKIRSDGRASSEVEPEDAVRRELSYQTPPVRKAA